MKVILKVLLVDRKINTVINRLILGVTFVKYNLFELSMFDNEFLSLKVKAVLFTP